MSLTLTHNKYLNCAEIVLKGSAFTVEDFNVLKDEVNTLIEEGNPNIILNFKAVKLLNSMGINMLIKIFTKCRNNGGDLYIVNISEKINHVLLLTKLNTVLNIANSTEEAINYFN